VNLIACVDKNFGIGCCGQLLFDNCIDKAYFKRLTLGKVVVMGRDTFESLPIRPLPNRFNVVMSTKEIKGVCVAKDKEQLLKILQPHSNNDIFVCGGQSVYEMLLDYCQYAYINKIEVEMLADRYLTNLDKSLNWSLVSQTIQRDIKFCLYQNRRIQIGL